MYDFYQNIGRPGEIKKFTRSLKIAGVFSSKNSLSASKNSPGRNLKIHGRSKNSRWIDPHFPGPPFDRPGPVRPCSRPRPAGPRSSRPRSSQIVRRACSPAQSGPDHYTDKVTAKYRHRQRPGLLFVNYLCSIAIYKPIDKNKPGPGKIPKNLHFFAYIYRYAKKITKKVKKNLVVRFFVVPLYRNQI